MESYSIRNGQAEIGVIVHEGREFAALGASVVGRHVTGYIKAGKRGRITLAAWDGRTMLACRSWEVETYRTEDWDETAAVAFHLPGGRAIVGYSLGDGCLFRGELIDGVDDVEAIEEAARAEAEHWRGVDEEDCLRDDFELDPDDALDFCDECGAELGRNHDGLICCPECDDD